MVINSNSFSLGGGVYSIKSGYGKLRPEPFSCPYPFKSVSHAAFICVVTPWRGLRDDTNKGCVGDFYRNDTSSRFLKDKYKSEDYTELYVT